MKGLLRAKTHRVDLEGWVQVLAEGAFLLVPPSRWTKSTRDEFELLLILFSLSSHVQSLKFGAFSNVFDVHIVFKSFDYVFMQCHWVCHVCCNSNWSTVVDVHYAPHMPIIISIDTQVIFSLFFTQILEPLWICGSELVYYIIFKIVRFQKSLKIPSIISYLKLFWSKWICYRFVAFWNREEMRSTIGNVISFARWCFVLKSHLPVRYAFEWWKVWVTSFISWLLSVLEVNQHGMRILNTTNCIVLTVPNHVCLLNCFIRILSLCLFVEEVGTCWMQGLQAIIELSVLTYKTIWLTFSLSEITLLISLEIIIWECPSVMNGANCRILVRRHLNIWSAS